MTAADTPPTAQETPVTLIELLFKKFHQNFPRATYMKDVETRVQKRMRQICQEIRATPGWMETLKLSKERSELFADVLARCKFRQEAEVIFEKLDYLASIDPGTGIQMSTVDYVWTSNTLIDKSIRDELTSLSALLEADSDFLAYHLDTDKHIQKLVDPYLYPFVLGRSRILSKPITSPIIALSSHTSTHLPADAEELKVFLNSNFRGSDEQDYQLGSYQYMSDDIAMLPTDFYVDSNGGIMIGSYISNLHPKKFSDFYPTISTIFSKFVLLFEQTLADIAYSCQEFTIKHIFYLKHYDEAFGSSRSDYTVSENQAYFCQLIESDNDDIIAFKRPERLKLHSALLGQRLQASIEMKTITLSPESPVYDGDEWHISGLSHENIAATGIYYYDCENISGGGLMFREYIQNNFFEWYLSEEDIAKHKVFFDTFDNIEDPRGFHPVSQEIGQIEIKDGLCVVYPNNYQSKGIGFKLADPTKAGHCKAFVFYLANPVLSVPSTAIVPPQQQTWWKHEIMKSSPIADLPSLITDNIFRYIEWPFSVNNALKIRKQKAEFEYYEIPENYDLGFEIKTYYNY